MSPHSQLPLCCPCGRGELYRRGLCETCYNRRRRDRARFSGRRDQAACYGASSSAFPQQFTGQQRDDESGMDYFGARYYRPLLGRFTSPDAPFADQFESDPQGWNLYSYVRNNPLKYFDDTGEAVKVASKQLEVPINVMRAESTSADTALGGYEGPDAPDITLVIGAAGFDADEKTPVIGKTTASIVEPRTTYGTPDDPEAIIKVPAQLKVVTVIIDSSIAKNRKKLENTLAHEIGHADDARTNTAQYLADSRRTNETRGATEHGKRPEEKRANRFRDRVNKERREHRKNSKKQLEQEELRD